jgi:hypothetical protein
VAVTTGPISVRLGATRRCAVGQHGDAASPGVADAEDPGLVGDGSPLRGLRAAKRPTPHRIAVMCILLAIGVAVGSAEALVPGSQRRTACWIALLAGRR